MKAVEFTDFGEASLRDVPLPEPAADEVLARVRRVQLSTTECHLYRGDQIAHFDAIASRLDRGDTRLFGHEFCAEIRDVGSDVDRLAVGDRVYAPGKISFGDCRYCETGYTRYCKEMEGIGYDRPGALAEYVTLLEEPLQRVSDAVSDAACAALQPFASAISCVEEANISPGDIVAVLGTGVMGSHCAQLALMLGAGSVIAIDIVERKLELAAENGMVAVDARTSDPVAVVEEHTDCVGADVVFECVGGDQSHGTEGDDPLAVANRSVRRGGRIVQVGHIVGDLVITPRNLRMRNVDWVNPARGVHQFGPNADTGELAARLVAADRINVESYVTHELHGLEKFQEAIDIGLDLDAHDALGPAQIVLD